MLNLCEIHKPDTIQDAVRLLQKPGTVALAGGTALNAQGRRDVQSVVDLSELGLSYLREDKGTVAIGAVTPLVDVTESPMLRAMAGGVLAQAAHRTISSVLRNQATVAGTLITEPDGILAVALLALDARVTLMRQETSTLSLMDFLSQRDTLLDKALLTEITVPLTNPRAAIETVPRTPTDKPIVAVCAAVRLEESVLHDVRLALGGVGATALRAIQAEQSLEGQPSSDAPVEQAAGLAVQNLAPTGDFRGSAEYRKEMARVLTRRALQRLI